jgi:hypothetical protein
MKSTKGKSAKAEGIEAIEVKQMGATRVGSEKSLAQPSPEDILELFGTIDCDPSYDYKAERRAIRKTRNTTS